MKGVVDMQLHAATTQDRPANQDEEGDGQNDNSIRTTPGQGDIPQNQSQNEAWQEPTQYYEPAQPPAPGPAQGQSHHGLKSVDSNQWRSWQPRQRQSQSQGQQGQASSSSWQDGWNQGQNDWNQGGSQAAGSQAAGNGQRQRRKGKA